MMWSFQRDAIQIMVKAVVCGAVLLHCIILYQFPFLLSPIFELHSKTHSEIMIFK